MCCDTARRSDRAACWSAGVLDAANEQAEAAADVAGIAGSARTPYILGAIADLTNGASVSANTALVANNAMIATAIAVALAAG